MDPQRKRRIRLVVALTAAVVLAGGLVYTSFTAASDAVSAKQLLSSSAPGRSYQLTGKVVDGSVHRVGAGMTFRVAQRDGTPPSVLVSYTGAVPDPFRAGREIIVTVHRGQGSSFVGERDSLVTKCPSKFKTAKSEKQY